MYRKRYILYMRSLTCINYVEGIKAMLFVAPHNFCDTFDTLVICSRYAHSIERR
jgi:hypothetical protein